MGTVPFFAVVPCGAAVKEGCHPLAKIQSDKSGLSLETSYLGNSGENVARLPHCV